MKKKFTVIVEQGEDGYLISQVVGLPGCHTQAKTHDQLIESTKEAIRVYLKTIYYQLRTHFFLFSKNPYYLFSVKNNNHVLLL